MIPYSNVCKCVSIWEGMVSACLLNLKFVSIHLWMYNLTKLGRGR